MTTESDRSLNAAPFRTLILGGGAIVAECHLPALRALGWLGQCLVVEPYERNADILRARYPGIQVTSEAYESVLCDPQCRLNYDGVLVALPNSLHLTAAERGLASGLPVLCEKPLALTAADCRRVEEYIRQHKRPVFVGMVRRFVPALTAMRAALADGWIGEVRRVCLAHGGDCRHWPWDTETVLRRDQGGCLVNMGIHFLDFLEWTFGRLQPVSYADDFAGGIEVNSRFHLETASGVPVEFKLSWTHELDNHLVVEGSCGTLTVRLDQYAEAEWHGANVALAATLKTPRPFTSGDWQPTFEACFAEQLWHFAQAARGAEDSESLLVRPGQAAETQDLIEWAYANRKPLTPRRVRPIVSQSRPELEPAPVVVTGGTGFVGSHLVARLAELGMPSIVVPVRNYRSGARAARYPITMQRVDLLDLHSCREVVRGTRHVFHLAYGTAGAEAEEVTVTGTRNVLAAALAEGVESVVVFSTCTVWAGHESGEVDETAPLKPALGAYGRAKARMQSECLAFARAHPGMRVCVVAPGAVYGPSGELFCRLPCSAAKNGSLPWFEGGRGTCNWVQVENLVDLAVLAARQEQAAGEVFIAVEGQTTWREFLTPLIEPWLTAMPDISREELTRLQQTGGRNGRLREVAAAALNSPVFMAAVSAHPVLGPCKDLVSRRWSNARKILQSPSVGAAAERILRSSGEPPKLALWMADIYGPARVAFSSRKAREVLGWRPAVTLSEGMIACLDWLRSVGLRN